MKFLTFLFIFFVINPYAQSSEIKVLKVKGQKAIVKILEGEAPQKGQKYFLSETDPADGEISLNNTNKNFNRNTALIISISHLDSEYTTKTTAGELTTETENSILAVRYGKNYGSFEFGGLLSRYGSKFVESNFSILTLGAYMEVFPLENTSGNYFVPFIGLDLGLVKYDEKTEGAPSSVSGSGYTYALGLGMYWYPGQQDYWAFKIAYEINSLSVDVDSNIQNITGSERSSNGLVFGLKGYF